MKAAEPKNTSAATAQRANQPFFSKEAEGNFFGESVNKEPSFFKPSPTHSVNGNGVLQTKLTIGEPNDKYEQEAEAMADKVVQRLATPDVLTKKETAVQAKPIVTSITPLVQAKCATCEQEDKLQKKEEEDLVQESPLGLQRKPIFESNVEPPDDNSLSAGKDRDEVVQRKCTTCDQEDKLQKKEEEDLVQESPLELQLKPIFESNAEPPDDNSLSVGKDRGEVVQRKCVACEQEDKLQKKEEEGLVEESPLELQRKPIFENNAEPPDDDNTVQRKCAECEKERVQEDKEEESVPEEPVRVRKMEGQDTPPDLPSDDDQGGNGDNNNHRSSDSGNEEVTVENQPRGYGKNNSVYKVDKAIVNNGVSDVSTNESGEALPTMTKLQLENSEEPELQVKENDSVSNASSSIESTLSTSVGSGTPLGEPVKSNMESAMGADFSNVRIHTDSSAIDLSKQLKAQAFTHGSDIYFNAGKYNVENNSGKHLLAHELTHTIQQGKANKTIYRKEEKVNYNLTYLFKNEWLGFGFTLSETTLTKVNNNPNSDALIKQGLDIVLHFEVNEPVYETPAFLKTDRVLKLIKAGIDAWPGNGIPEFRQFDDLIYRRSLAVTNTLFLEKINLHLRDIHGIDPSYIDWKLLIPDLKADTLMWTPKHAIEATEFDQYEWVLDLLMDEVKGFAPVVGARIFDISAINNILYPFIVNNEALFTKEIVREHSEKFVMPWLVKIASIKYIPDEFILSSFAPDNKLWEIERSRERLLKDYIEKEVPDIVVTFILDTWTASGVNTDVWLKNLNVDAYKANVLDKLTDDFLKKAKPGTEYFEALKLQALEKTKFNIIRMFYFKAVSEQKLNIGLEERFRKGYKENLDKDMQMIVENPAEYHDLSVKIASATTKFLGSIQPDRSIAYETFKLVSEITDALKVPEHYAALGISFIAFINYIKEFQKSVDEEKSRVREAIKERIKVDYDSIAKVVKNWVKIADEFMDKKFKPMLKKVALEWLAKNKKEIENILANYDSANAKFAEQMKAGADELQEIEEGLANEEYDAVEFQGKLVTKKDLPELKTTIQFMRDEANARLSTKHAEKEKGKLKEALEGYDEVREDIIDDEFDWIDYTKEVFVEARRRLGIGEFPDYANLHMIFSGQVVAEKNPFLAMVIQNWRWKENAEREAWVFLKMAVLGIFSVAIMFVPGVGGLVLAAIDISIGIGMGVKGVVDAKEILRMAKMDLHGTIRGVSVEQAEKALNQAWFGLAVSAILTIGPAAVGRALNVRGAGGVVLSKPTRGWEKTLNKATRDALKANPALRKIYSQMDEGVRSILTLCKSPCIPMGYGPTKAEVDRIKQFMKDIKIPNDHRGFREYLHHPSRRENLTAAMDGMKGVTNKSQFEAVLDRAIQANVKQVGASANKVNGLWHYTRPDGLVVKEYEIAIHGTLSGDRGTSRFFQSHHGIQDAWAVRKGIPGYARDDCPAILLRDSKMGTPHQVVSARQSGRFDQIATRSYADERLLLKADMKAAGVPDAKANSLLAQSDAYFGKIYKQLEAQGKTVELTRIFGTWKPK